MLSIKAGDIFLKNYIDHSRYFIAIHDSVGLYCDCVDINSGEREMVKIPVPWMKNSTSVEILS